MQRVFGWQCPDGRSIDWWMDDVNRDPCRFVYNEWGYFSLAVDLRSREVQIQFSRPYEWISIKFAEIVDEDTRLALEAACDARQSRFVAELLLRIINRDDMVDRLYTPKEPPRAT